MSVTFETVRVSMVTWQVDDTGRTFCGAHVQTERGGTVRTLEPRALLRSSEHDDRALWTCDACRRYVADWPWHMEDVGIEIEHTAARIF